MPKTLILAEKPSQAQDIARGIGESFARAEGCLESSRYIVTWAYGHLVELVEPQDYDEKYKSWSLNALPIIPAEFKYKVTKAGAKQFKAIKALLSRTDIDKVVNSTDPGREGELIARLILRLAGNRKPVYRFWTSKALTPEAVKEGMANLKPSSDYDRLYHSAMARQHADWIVGINGTRICSVKAGKLFPVGRVQTPTLALLVQREREISGFKPRNYWNLEAAFSAGSADTSGYKGLWVKSGSDDEDSSDEQKESQVSSQFAIDKKESAMRIQQELQGGSGVVRSVKSAVKREQPPLLFSLTVLQQEANKLFGYPADKTLTIAQALYEKKLCTYPRTESQHLNEELEGECKSILKKLATAFVFDIGKCTVTAKNKRVFDSAKLTDHHALMPTGRTNNGLSKEEMNLLDLIARRFISSFYPDFRYKHTAVVTAVGEHFFRTNGKVVVDKGWKEIYGGVEKDTEIPELKQGMAVKILDSMVIDKQTTPPARYTDASLLAVMTNASRLVTDSKIKAILKDTAGIGTSATRASIIKGLQDRQYIERKGKALIPTEKAFTLIGTIENEKISSVGWTGLWEQELEAIAAGSTEAAGFMNGIKNYTLEFIEKIKGASISYSESKGAGKGAGKAEGVTKTAAGNAGESLGDCPECGKQVKSGTKAYYCESWKETGCKFSLWKNSLEKLGKKELTLAMAKKLLQGREVKLTKLKSKAGKSFDAKGVLQKKENNYWGIRLVFGGER